MKVRIEVTTDELEDMGCDSVDELAARLREQLDSGIVGGLAIGSFPSS